MLSVLEIFLNTEIYIKKNYFVNINESPCFVANYVPVLYRNARSMFSATLLKDLRNI